MKNRQITKVYYVTCWFDKFFNMILKTINLLCPFQKAFGIEVQARSWASSKFALAYPSPGHGREPITSSSHVFTNSESTKPDLFFYKFFRLLWSILIRFSFKNQVRL